MHLEVDVKYVHQEFPEDCSGMEFLKGRCWHLSETIHFQICNIRMFNFILNWHYKSFKCAVIQEEGHFGSFMCLILNQTFGPASFVLSIQGASGLQAMYASLGYGFSHHFYLLGPDTGDTDPPSHRMKPRYSQWS